MADFILPPAETLARAGAELARENRENTSRTHAINKAVFYLQRGGVDLLHSHDGFLIASSSRPGVVHRIHHVDGCSCEAGQRGRACWHVAVVDVLQRASRYTLPTFTAPLRGGYAEASAAMDEVFG